MEKKSILFVYYKLFKSGGVARVMSNLANELVNQGYQVEILLLSGEQTPFYPLDPRIKIHYVDMFSHWAWDICEFNAKHLKFIPKIKNLNTYISHIGVFLLLKKWLNTHHQRYDTIISCWYKLSCFLAMNPKVAKKTIAWEHTDYNAAGFLYGKKLRNFYKNLKNIICINSPSIHHYQKFNKNTHFIANIIGEPFESKKEIPLEKKENLISFVGRLDKGKNVMDLLEIFAESNLPNDWKLQIIGEGWEENHLKNFVKENNLEHRILFLGNKNTEEVSQLLDKSKIFGFTSLREGLPTVLIEALFSSNVLISYDCNFGPSDIISEGKNGFLVPLKNKEIFKKHLEKLANNKNLYQELHKNSFISSQQWKKEKILDSWKTIL